MLEFVYYGKKIWVNPEYDLNSYRISDFEEIMCESNDQIYITFLKRKYISLVALTSIFKTILICVLLTIGSAYFSQDANNLVLIPIERMVEIVKLIV